MAQTIENLSERTLLQQFHALKDAYNNDLVPDVNKANEDIAQEIQDRTDADAELSYDIGELEARIDALGNVFTLKGSVADATGLPTENNHVGDVWYVEDESTGYVWIDDNGTERWEQLGLTVDLSDYVTQTDLSTALEDKQDKLTAGTNISIIGDTISATQPDTSKFEMLSGVSAPSTATAGAVGQKYLDTTKNDVYVCTAKTDNGDDTFSYTWLLTGGNGKQNKLTAGTNITISGDVISASGGGSQLYCHHITLTTLIDGASYGISFDLYSDRSSPYTALNINTIGIDLYNRGVVSGGQSYKIPMCVVAGNVIYEAVTIYGLPNAIGATLIKYEIDFDNKTITRTNDNISVSFQTDNVTSI